MNLRGLSVFTQVVEAGGFSAAARLLSVPKSAVSAGVSRLEAELGVRLLQRSSRHVTPTAAGAALHAKVGPALEVVQAALGEVAEMQGELKGTVRITAPVEAGTRLLEPVVARFLRANPAVNVEVLLTSRVVDLAAEGFDLAIRGGRVRDESLIARTLGAADAGLFASRVYLAAHGTPRRVSELAHHHAVALHAAGPRVTWALSGPRGEERIEARARLVSEHFPFVLRAVHDGVGIALLPLYLCTREVERGDLVRVLPRYAQRGTPMNLVYPSARYLPHRVAALRDLILREVVFSSPH